MTGLYGVTWGSSSAYWGQSFHVGQQGRLTGVSRTQPQASDQPVTPVTATPAVSREQPSAVTLTGSALPNYREGADPAEMAVRGPEQGLCIPGRYNRACRKGIIRYLLLPFHVALA